MEKDAVLVSDEIYRPGTKISRTKVGLVYNSGGVGDYIQWTTAIQYAIETNPHIYGFIAAPVFFFDLAKLWLSKYEPRFEIICTESFETDVRLNGVPLMVPCLEQYANACGHHLFQLGFIYYNQINFIPKGYDRIPEIRGDEADVSRFALPADFVVVNTLATHDNRRLPAKSVNEIFKFLRERGTVPVVLGKGKINETYVSKDSEGIDYSLALDLRDRTNLIEAACVMAKARLVFGLDNGLLHLAACSSVPVIFIFTTVDPRLRLPPREEGAKTVAITPGANIPCRFCNSRMKFVIGHNFKNCLYKDNACVNFPPEFLIKALKEHLI